MSSQSIELFRAAQVRELDRTAIEEFGCPGAELMERAGSVAFDVMQKRWPLRKKIAVLCGVGNNAGDGFVLARLAHQAAMQVAVFSVGKLDRLRGDAKTMAEKLEALGVKIEEWNEQDLQPFEIIVDAILGTGFTGELRAGFADAVNAINRHAPSCAVLALDIPSGLDADTGHAASGAVIADATVTFIGRKQGLYTGDAGNYCGDILFSDLQVPPETYDFEVASAQLLDEALYGDLPRRLPNSHKGQHGHVVIIGGNHGYIGALRLAAEAALRSGAGKVSVVTRAAHAALLSLQRPEIMAWGMEDATQLTPLLSQATCLVIGPGLGQDHWARQMWQATLHAPQPMVVDADALAFLNEDLQLAAEKALILTPHPGEAARLLGVSNDVVQADRFQAIDNLYERFPHTMVLKGHGSLIRGEDGITWVCTSGNAGMAVAGMGDVLSGVIAALTAQGLAPLRAAQLGAYLHGQAGDLAAEQGQLGLLAADLFPYIRQLVNRLSMRQGV